MQFFKQRRLKLFISILKTKGSLITGFLLLFAFSSSGQERFNIRFDSGFDFTIFSGLEEVDSGYLVTGIVVDAEGFSSNRPVIFTKFNYQGGIEFQKSYGGDELLKNRIFSSQNPDLQFLNDTVLIHSGVTRDADWIRHGYLMKSNLEGDTLETIRFYSPNYPEDIEHSSMYPIRLEQSTDGNFLVLSGIVNDITNNDILIQKFTPEGELLWDYQYATEQDPDYCEVIIPTNDGGVIMMPKLILETPPSTNNIIKLGSNGIVEWDINTDFEQFTGTFKDAILENEFIVASSAFKDEESPGGVPGVIKLDTLGNLIWHTPIWENDNGFEHRGRQLIKAHDGNYITGGIHYENIPDVPDDSSGFLAKVSTEGEVKWQRRFKYFDLFNDEHELYDLRATSDGGYIFCGEAKGTDEDNPDVTGPYQQGWLVKVDEHGCLVEGCEEFDDSVSEIEAENIEYFKAGPVPANQFLNIYQIQQLSLSAVYELYDMQGRLMKSIPVVDKNTTLMVDISDLSSGNYVLSLKEGSKRLQQQKVTID